MSNWRFWDWVGYGCIGIAAIGLAVADALDKLPKIAGELPALLRISIWAYIPLILFGMGSLVLALRTARARMKNTATKTGAIRNDTKVPAAMSKVFVSRAPEDLMDAVGGYTEVQREKIVEIYKGKWIRVSGRVKDVQSHYQGGMLLLLDTNDPKYLKDVTLVFREPWTKCLEVTHKGQRVAAVGKIDQISPYGLSLRDCELSDDEIGRPADGQV